MSIIIKGINPPDDCDSCWFPYCNLWLITDVGERHPECPIVEVKGRLINADDICFSMTNRVDQDIAEEAIKDAPTVAMEGDEE